MPAGKIFAISFAINAMMGGSFNTAMSQASSAMRRLDEKTKELNNEQKRLNNAWNQSQAAVRDYQSKIQSLKAQLEAGKISQSQYDSAVRRAGEAMRASAMSVDEYRTHMARLRQETAQTQAKLEQFKGAVAAKNQAAASFAQARAGVFDTASMVGMIATPFVASIQTAAAFEASMSKVQAITRANGDEIKKLTDNARMLGETTQFSATQAANAMSYLGMAGWNTEQIMAGMPGLLALAAAGGTDLARTADIVSDDLTAFGLSAENASHMADVFAVTATRTNTNVEMIGETMKYAAPVARAFGASMEETAALTGLMANAGVKASQAGTSLRAGFLRLAGPPKKSAKAMEELGISMSDLSAQQAEASQALKSLGIDMDSISGTPSHKMVAILTELKEKTAGLSDEQKLATMQAIFGTEAATGWLNVLEAGPDVFESLVKEMENCDGEAEKMAAVMMDNAQGAWIQFKSAVEGVAISIGSIFLPGITSALKHVATFTGSLSGLIKEHEGVVGSIVSVGASLGTAILALQSYRLASAGWAYCTASLNVYKLGLKNVLAQILQTAAGQRALTASTMAQARAMAMFNTATSSGTYKSLGQSLLQTYNQLRAITWAQIGQSIKNGIVGGLSSTKTAIIGFKNSVIAAMTQAKQAVMVGARAIAVNLLNAGRAVITFVRGISIASMLQKAAAGQRALTASTMAQARAMAMFNTATSSGTYKSLGQSLLQTYNQLRAITWAQIGQSIKNGIVGGLSSTKTAIIGFKNSVIAAMTQAKQAVMVGARAIAVNLLNAGRAVITFVRGISIASMLQKAAAGFRVLGSAIMGIGRAGLATMFSPIGLAIMAIAGAAYLIYANWESVGPFFMGLWQQIQAAFAGAWTMIQPALAQLQASFGILINAIGPALASLGTVFMDAFNQISMTVAANSGVFDIFIQALTFLAELLGGVLVGAFIVFANAAVGTITMVVGSTASLIAGMIGILSGLIEFITGVFTGNWSMAWQGIQDIFSSIWNAIGGIANSVLNGIQSTINGIVSSIKGLAGKLPSLGGGGGKDIAHNARGGIYGKGAFLTTFAEDSPEAAIPLDGSPRAIGLWRKAGEILGIGSENPGNAPMPAGIFGGTKESTPMNAPPISISLNFTGNFEPDEIRKAVEKAGQTVQRSFAEEMEKYNMERRRLAFG